jgi:peptide-methionine (S)-S-oxide reductase
MSFRLPGLRAAACGAVAIGAIGLAAIGLPEAGRAAEANRVLPPPALDAKPGASGLQTAVFSGGCFWGIQGVFEHVNGVKQAVSGYAGGHVASPDYEQVSSGATGHAESVRVTFDPAVVSYGKLLQIFFSVALDPTEVDRQGPDWGTQYRSELFVKGPEQETVARAYIAQLEAAHAFEKKIATRIDPAGPFYPAEGYHQDYLLHHPDNPYIAINDMPKLDNLRKLFPQNWQDSAVTVREVASAE